MTFLVAGDANADLSGTLASFPREGDDTTLRSLSFHGGGSSANVAVALARLGAPARLFARVGVDPAAEVALSAARAAGVDLGHVQRDRASVTGLCFAAISPGGERTLFGFRGANVALSTAGLGAAIEGARWLHVGGHALIEGAQREAARALIAEAERRGLPISIDLCLPLLRAEHGAATMDDLAPRASVLFANRLEMELLEALRAPAPRVMVEKRGAEGARVITAAERVSLPGFAVGARDTTGCGDAFVAGFILAVARGASPRVAAELGNAAGALTATRPGAAESLPTHHEACAFLAERGAEAALSVLRQAP